MCSEASVCWRLFLSLCSCPRLRELPSRRWNSILRMASRCAGSANVPIPCRRNREFRPQRDLVSDPRKSHGKFGSTRELRSVPFQRVADIEWKLAIHTEHFDSAVDRVNVDNSDRTRSRLHCSQKVLVASHNFDDLAVLIELGDCSPGIPCGAK